MIPGLTELQKEILSQEAKTDNSVITYKRSRLCRNMHKELQAELELRSE